MQAEPTKSAPKGTPWPERGQDANAVFEAAEEYAHAHLRDDPFVRAAFVALVTTGMECRTVEQACEWVSRIMCLLDMDETDRACSLLESVLEERREGGRDAA